MIRYVATILTLLMLPLMLLAQDRPNTILVMDGSGSMWGQIDGVNKIVIAREVVTDILQDFPADENLGLTVYGHRTEGDCADIETVVPPAPGTGPAIVGAVNAINPRGRTPMTDAVIAAAEALGYRDAPATVILVSDGIETCNPDPCAAARALEQSGADFTAHVIGFDVADAVAIGQLQCLAGETGGVFLSAANADELSAALTQVAVAPEPEPEPEPVLTPVTFQAVVGEGGPLIADPVFWTITPAPEGTNGTGEGNPLTGGIQTGSYTITATWSVAEQTQQTQISLLGAEPRTVTVVFEEPLPTATLQAPETAVAGSTIEVAWQGPDASGDFIATGNPGEATYATYALTRDGAPSVLRVPSQPGPYELRYVLGDRGVVLATQVLNVTPATATLIAPDTAVAGDTIEVAWQGPDYQPDYIAVSVPGEPTQINYTLTREGSPLDLTMPVEPGTYELRYVMQVDRHVIATKPIEVTDVLATLEAPETAVAGSTVQVAWQGPDYQNDFISVSVPDDDGSENYTYTREGAPLDLLMPTEPGTYEIRYVEAQDRKVLATRQITLTPVTASLVVPETAAVGSDIEVAWEGPDYQNDFVAVSKPDDEGYESYAYTRDGSPLDLTLPTETGTYEVRYYIGQDRRVIARETLVLESVSAGITAPAEAVAGSSLEVAWEGPDYKNDFIAISDPDDEGWESYTYTRAGSPLDLTLPTEPGTYELRYVVGQDRTVLATVPITLTKVGAEITAPAEAVAGSNVEVSWQGPDYKNDFVSVSLPDDEGWESYTYTRTGNPLDLTLPTEPGLYELRYVVGQDRTVLATVPITVTDVSAKITAPESAVAGSDIAVAWEGPDYKNDFIAVSRPDDEGYEAYTYTREGAPLDLSMPTEPGTYELRYYVGQDRTVLATRPIEVTEVTASLQVPQSAVVGDTIEIAWQGPDYHNDFIAVSEPDSDRWVNYTYTREGAPLDLAMPPEPGTYQVRYVVNQDRKVIATAMIEVADLTVSLQAPESAAAGGTVEVAFDGPAYNNDLITITAAGADRHSTYAYAERGNPAELDVPEEPGEYEIRYTMHQGKRQMASVPFRVEPAE